MRESTVASGIDEAKRAIRNQVWDRLERAGAVDPGVHGYIPAFEGATAAADRLAQLPVWQAARVVKAVPDRAQQPVRERALRDGKLLYMAVPKLADDLPFYVLDPARLTGAPAEAASREGAARAARKVNPGQMRPVQLVVCGSVAVNRAGVRLGGMTRSSSTTSGRTSAKRSSAFLASPATVTRWPRPCSQAAPIR